MSQAELFFIAGTLVWSGTTPPATLQGLLQFDSRTEQYRCRGCDYAELINLCRTHKIALTDHALGFHEEKWQLKLPWRLREHQQLAYEHWKANKWRGVAALPTGGGKSFLAMYAIYKLQRPTIILVPTIDLLHQWSRQLEKFFGVEVGVLGGGSKTVLPLTVATYDSAVLQMEFIGNRFALLVCDECHHLPGRIYRTAAEQSIAPYRLGLSATPECSDSERTDTLNELVGEVIYQVEVSELTGGVLAPYTVESIAVELTESEHQEYEQMRQVYRDFVRRNRINFASSNGWKEFLLAVARRPDGKSAFNAYLRQREISRQGEEKLLAVWELIRQHYNDRIIIFTADNAMAYRIGREFRLPVITHQTPAAERKEMLEAFRQGDYPILTTSKVLNEGIDVPEATVGIIVSGSASVREHVQRLGRILRAAPDKQAILYEIINANTAEIHTVKRRRTHNAYQGKVDE